MGRKQRKNKSFSTALCETESGPRVRERGEVNARKEGNASPDPGERREIGYYLWGVQRSTQWQAS